MLQGQPFLLDETGADESFLVGTRAQLEAFARSILDALEEASDSTEWHGVPVEQRFSGSPLTDTVADVVLGGVVVVESEADRRRLVNAIRENCGDPTIDWVGRDAHLAKFT